MQWASDDPSSAAAGSAESGMPIGFDGDVQDVPIPPELPVLPLRGVVVFPSAIAPLLVSRPASVTLVDDCVAGDRMLALVSQQSPDVEQPAPEELFSRGTAGRILKTLRYPDGSIRILVQGVRRIDVVRYVQREPYFRAEVRPLPDDASVPDVAPLVAHVGAQFGRFVSMIPYL